MSNKNKQFLFDAVPKSFIHSFSLLPFESVVFAVAVVVVVVVVMMTTKMMMVMMMLLLMVVTLTKYANPHVVNFISR